MKKYNGHDSYNAWNISLWINNEEPLYLLAKNALHVGRSLERAAQIFLSHVKDSHTPDGVRYTKTNVIKAMRGM